jgi:hypothetical protein
MEHVPNRSVIRKSAADCLVISLLKSESAKDYSNSRYGATGALCEVGVLQE